ncbi:hypothetical protein [Nonomuraea rubra]|uniref:Uncharacterized protein n=1 Tax=Nonomuraea rubra TaxID=46180 RepID=A0A7X0P0H2_9ACTN|nr:hypothetical protein [Nonomuraea rubra]MBB6552937.1 hypothetical protein [Nonomuraea rubra]
MTGGRRVVVSRRPAALAGRGTPSPPGDSPDVPAIVGLQLRRALRTVAAVAGLLVGMPVLAAWLPGPWMWAAMSVAVQCVWVGLSLLQLRWAERLER